MARSKHHLSDEEREQRRVADRERLKQASQQLLCSEGWQRWIRVRARGGMSRYSLNNQLLIALQRPEATFVAGFHNWKALGYGVRKGEKGIRILAPMTLKDREREGEPAPDESPAEPRVLFRTVAVFDRSQVDPIPGREPAPLHAPIAPLTGDSHAHLLRPLSTFATSLGFTLTTKPLTGGADGWCNYETKEIVENANLPVNARVRVRVHELAHALGVSSAKYGRDRAEVIVDTVTYIVCAGAGLDTGGETIPYITGWGERGALEAVSEFAGTIHAIARQLEDAIAPDDESHAETADDDVPRRLVA